jgi:acyl transferase domain-containing protein
MQHYHTDVMQAGMKIEEVAGSNTSVFVGCLSDDYKTLNSKDPERLAQYATTGVLDSMLANRLSWFYNFTGNSVTLDTACSSSLIALDLACQGLLTGESDMVRNLHHVIQNSQFLISPDHV